MIFIADCVSLFAQGRVSRESEPVGLVDMNMYRLENKQVYNETITLDDLRLVIRAMGDVLVHYKLLSVCY